MFRINDKQLNFNRKVKFNFSGGDLTSDAGLLLLKEFEQQIGFNSVVSKNFGTKENKNFREHSDASLLAQKVYQTITGYFTDSIADEISHDPMFKALLNKGRLASQPTLSRFFNRLNKDSLQQLLKVQTKLQHTIYSIKNPDSILIDVDSTSFETFGKQENTAYNAHYHNTGYHPLLAYDGLTGDLLKAELRKGSCYTSKNVVKFLTPLLDDFQQKLPKTKLFLRGDSGFAIPKLYKLLETNSTSYVIRLKANNNLYKSSAHIDQELNEIIRQVGFDYAVYYDEFEYQSKSWDYPRRVVVKAEKLQGQLIPRYSFIVTNMDLSPEQTFMLYNNRGHMENFIKECKTGFNFRKCSSQDFITNQNRLQISVLAYNLFNWFRRLALSPKMRHLQISTIRTKLIKIAAKLVKGARYLTFKLCSSCPYRKEFYETLANIYSLSP